MHRILSTKHLACVLVATLLSVCATSSPAHALDGMVWVSAGGSSLQPGQPYRQLGVGSQLGLNLNLQERWGAEVGVSAMRYGQQKEFELEPLLVTDVFAGVRYNLDYFKYIPYVSVDAVLFAPNALRVGDPEQGQVGVPFGGRLVLGMLWRPRREWSLGGHLDLTGSIPDFGLSSALWIDFGYHWRW